RQQEEPEVPVVGPEIRDDPVTRDHEQTLALREVGDGAVETATAESRREVALFNPILQGGGSLHVLRGAEGQMVGPPSEDEVGQAILRGHLVLNDRELMDARERVVVSKLDRDFPRSLRDSQVLLELTECSRNAETEASEHVLVVVHAQDLAHGRVAVQAASAELLAIGSPG